MESSKSEDIVVIGAGIIGIAIAESFASMGRSVLIVDRKGVAEEASAGNAGALSFSDIFPLASPNILKKAPKWLLDPLGPLAIRPKYLIKILPWLFQFALASRPSQFRKGTEATVQLNRLASTAFHTMMSRVGAANMIRSDGSLQLYESEKELNAAQVGWDIRQSHEIDYEHVRGNRLAELQPGLSPKIVAATFVPHWQTVSDPKEVTLTIAKYIQDRGVQLKIGSVVGVKPSDNGAKLLFANGEELSANHIVIAAGAWSTLLTKQLGDNIPLETERGYNTTLPNSAFDLRRQLIFGAHGFVATPLTTGIRIGGAVEFAGLNMPPNFNRSAAMLGKAAELLKGLDISGGKQWMGFRPSLPDSLPVIGQSSVSPAIIYAFGHGHSGLTQSAATARLIAEIVSATKPSIPLEPFRPDRF